jgi:acyl carrier protein
MNTTNDAQGSRRAKLFELISCEILEVGPDFTEQSDLFDAGLDSMAIMQLLLLIEKTFGIRLPAAKLTRANFSSIEDLARLIDAEAASK